MSTDTSSYRIDLLSLGGWPWAPGFEIYWMEPGAPDEPLELVGVLIRGHGRTILVNTGPDPDMLATLNARWRNFDPRHQLEVSPTQQLTAALASVGVAPAEVDTVVVTPFQPYAIGNLIELPTATYCLSRTGWIDFHATRWRDHPHDYRPFVIPENILVALVTDRWPQLRLIEDEDEIAPGIEVFWTGGHHRSSMAISVPTPQGVAVISDCFFRRENITQKRPLGINESMEEILIAYQRIDRTADILIPLYDPGVFTRHPNGIG
jgi:glyoxylase-like metal-dependent hydrolase (beta-lactamase superfamily II)